MRSSDWSSDVCSSDLGHSVPEASNHYLYLIKLTFSTGCCYPEGNFGGNQLLDGSISLSPLYPSSTINLHVRIATSLHQSFPRSEEHTSELQSLMRISYAVFCLKKKNNHTPLPTSHNMTTLSTLTHPINTTITVTIIYRYAHHLPSL